MLPLHSSGKSFVDYMNLTPLADRHNFIIIAPTGSVKYIPSIGGFTWNISYVPVQDSNLVDEAGTKYYRGQDRNYLSALLTQAQSYGCVEKTKTYLAGMSGGGRMASSIACAGGISQKIGAIATFSSLRAGPADPNADPAFSQVLTKDLTYADSSQNVYACAPSHGLGIFAVHGKADNTNPFDGKTTDGTYKKQWGYSIPSATKRWSDLFSCKAMPDKPVANSEAVNSTWSCPQLAATNAAINLYVIDKLGHNLPTKDQPGVGSFDYQEAMWSFVSTVSELALLGFLCSVLTRLFSLPVPELSHSLICCCCHYFGLSHGSFPDHLTLSWNA